MEDRQLRRRMADENSGIFQILISTVEIADSRRLYHIHGVRSLAPVQVRRVLSLLRARRNGNPRSSWTGSYSFG